MANLGYSDGVKCYYYSQPKEMYTLERAKIRLANAMSGNIFECTHCKKWHYSSHLKNQNRMWRMLKMPSMNELFWISCILAVAGMIGTFMSIPLAHLMFFWGLAIFTLVLSIWVQMVEVYKEIKERAKEK